MLAKKENNLFNDVQTKKRIHEHLSNENDRISEEDINNVKTNIAEGEGVDSIHSVEDENLPGKKPAADSVESAGRTNEPRIETPWNMLDE